MILFVVDTRDGLMPLDQEVARRLRYVDAPVICVANKADDATHRHARPTSSTSSAAASWCCASTLQNRNRQLLLDMIVERLPKADADEAEAAPTNR